MDVHLGGPLKNKWGWIFTAMFIGGLFGLLFMVNPTNLTEKKTVKSGENKDSQRKALVILIDGLDWEAWEKTEDEAMGIGFKTLSGRGYFYKPAFHLGHSKNLGERRTLASVSNNFYSFENEKKKKGIENDFDQAISLISFPRKSDLRLRRFRTFNLQKEPILEGMFPRLKQSLKVLKFQFKEGVVVRPDSLPKLSVLRLEGPFEASLGGKNENYFNAVRKSKRLIRGVLDYLYLNELADDLSIVITSTKGPAFVEQNFKLSKNFLNDLKGEYKNHFLSSFESLEEISKEDKKEILSKEGMIISKTGKRILLEKEGSLILVEKDPSLEELNNFFNYKAQRLEEYLGERGVLTSLFSSKEKKQIVVFNSKDLFQKKPLIFLGNAVFEEQFNKSWNGENLTSEDMYPTLNSYLNYQENKNGLLRNPASKGPAIDPWKSIKPKPRSLNIWL